MDGHECRPSRKEFSTRFCLENMECETCGAEIEPLYWRTFILLRILRFALFVVFWVEVPIWVDLPKEAGGWLEIVVDILAIGAGLGAAMALNYAMYRVWGDHGWYKKIGNAEVESENE